MKLFAYGNLNSITVDNLNYEYTGNKLTALHEKANPVPQYDVYPRGVSQTGTYQYDLNGNMTHDSRKNLKLGYNFLNLISGVTEGSMVKSNYTWLADGTKLSARQPGDNGYEYMGSLMYQYVNGQRKLESATFGAGRIIANNGTQTTYVPNYYITDHLGSVRVVWDGANVVGRNDYYPSGAVWNNAGNMASNDRFKYNGKEDQSLFGIDYLDYGARMYDSKLGIWHSSDPLAEKYYSFSPYNYTANNPIRFIDPHGLDVWEMDYMGYFSYFSNEGKDHTVYAVGSDGLRTGASIVFADTPSARSMLEQLVATSQTAGQPTYATGKNPSELGAMFLFASNNTIVEWRFSRFNRGNGDEYAIGTIHKIDEPISPEQMGFSRYDEIAFIHSHPTKYSKMTGEFGEHGSMGWRLLSNLEADFRGDPRGTVELTGDSYNVRFNDKNYPTWNDNYLTYFPHSGNIYNVRGAEYPAFIRNISGHNYNPNVLFWGTLNGR